MTVSESTLLDAIETSLFVLDDIPGKYESVNIPGVLGHVSQLSHPLINLVGAATLTPENVDETIKRVHDLYASQDKAYSWIVGPLSTPTDLGDRLSRNGMVVAEEIAGLALTDLSVPIRTNPAVQVREASTEDMLGSIDMVATAYGMPPDVAELWMEAVSRSTGKLTMRGYLAYLADGDEPVAFSYLTYLPGQSVVVLGGAATLEDHRGEGIYTTLVAKRLEVARAHGAEAAVMQAVRATSAPICEKIGFQEMGGMDWYAWAPEMASAQSE